MLRSANLIESMRGLVSIDAPGMRAGQGGGEVAERRVPKLS